MSADFRRNQLPKNDPEAEVYMTPGEVARLTRLTSLTIHKYCRLGLIKHIRVTPTSHGRIRITVAEVRRFFKIPPERPIRIEVVERDGRGPNRGK